MSNDVQLPKNDPRIIAWEAYKETPEYANNKKWVQHKVGVDGSLWAAFLVGYDTALSSSERDLSKAEMADTKIRLAEMEECYAGAIKDNDLLRAELSKLRAPVREKGEAADMVCMPRYVWDFLCGKTDLEGAHFGDRHPDYQGSFWWRKVIDGLLVTQPDFKAGMLAAAEMCKLEASLWAAPYNDVAFNCAKAIRAAAGKVGDGS